MPAGTRREDKPAWTTRAPCGLLAHCIKNQVAKSIMPYFEPITPGCFKHTHDELVFTRDFIFGTDFSVILKGKEGINYSGSMRSHYQKSILGTCCAPQPL